MSNFYQNRVKKYMPRLFYTKIINPLKENLKKKGLNQSSKASNQWCRIVMEKATADLILNLNYREFNALEISGGKWKDFGFKFYKSVDYPDFDICENTLNEKFDLIIAEQVFEHILYPYRAIKNVYSMLNQGGIFLITTPFLIKYHPTPDDCTRWTETGMKHFLAEGGFSLKNINIGSWGNKNCLIANLNNWKEYDPQNHSLENEKEYPMVVWAVAHK